MESYFVRLGLTVAIAFVVVIFKLSASFWGTSPAVSATSRTADINRWKLAGTEIASYDTCRKTLGTTQGAVPSGSFCGCLVASGASSLQDVPVEKLKPVLVATYTAAVAPETPKELLQLASVIDTGSRGCRKPKTQPKRDAQISINGETRTLREWRELARRAADDDDRPELPLLSSP
jgi:hypothetical protein